jgi:hypothetical protein
MPPTMCGRPIGYAPRHGTNGNSTNQLSSSFADVGQRLAVLFDVGCDVDFVDRAQTVLVVAGLVAPLDLVVRLLSVAEVRLEGDWCQIDVAIHATLHALHVLELRQILDVRLALRAVEVGRGERQVHVVDGDEQELGPVARLVPCHLHVLRAAERHLRQELLKLCAELRALHRELPVHEVRLALGLLELVDRRVAGDEVLDRTLRREQLLDGAGGEVHARLGQHRMHDLGRALELRAAGRVVAQTSAAQALFVLLVALLARLFVLADQVKVRRGQRAQLALGHGLGEVGVEVVGALLVLVVQLDDCATVLGVDDVGLLVLWHFDHLWQFVFVHGLVLHAA